MASKRVEKREKMNKTKDRISDLPDPIIEHILYFLPSTKQSIQTTVLSKRWRNQWTQVPVLIFNSTGMSPQNFLKLIDNTLLLHDCSKIHKFHLLYDFHDPHFAEKTEFAATKHVEDLYLSACTEVILPEILFNNASLVKLKTRCCSFMPNGKVNWGCLTSLEMARSMLPNQALQHILSGSPSLRSLKLISCVADKIVIASKSLTSLSIDFCEGKICISVVEISCPNLNELSLKYIFTEDPQMLAQAIENVVSGSLLLESFELIGCPKLYKLVVASKSLKRLIIEFCEVLNISINSVVEISCPNLKEFSLKGMDRMCNTDPHMLAQAIENVLSSSLLLESFELIGCSKLDKLVIASKSLKKLVVRDVFSISSYIEISSPQLEELKLLGYVDLKTAKLLDLPSSLCATMDFYHHQYWGKKTCKSSIMEILQQLQQLKELKIGSWFLKVLSTIEVGGQFTPVLNIKCLTLNSPYVIKHHSGIARLLHISPVLEKLVINVLEDKKVNHKNIGQNYWKSNEAVFNCLVSHLKTFKIIGFLERAGRREHILNLIEFVLGNARVLENMVVILDDHIGTSPVDLSQILKSFPIRSQKAIIDVLLSANSNKEIRNFL